MGKELRVYQKAIINYILDKPRCGVFAGMGMGKTVSVLTAVDILILCGKLKGKVLIVAPLRVAQSTWPDELQEWPHLRDLTMSVVTGSKGERVAALKRDCDIYVTNYENLPWLDEVLGKRWPFEMVVADESTKLKGFRTRQGTKRARALAVHAFDKTKRFVQLTGTPAPNGVKDLWACGWFIDRGERLLRSYSAFVNKWFVRDRSGFGYDPLPHAAKEIEEALSDVCYSLRAEEYFDIDEPIVNEIMVELPPKALTQYKEMEKKMYTVLEEEHEIEAVNAATRTMKCLQLANGAAYVDDKADEWTEVHDVKIKALEEVVEEAMGMPVLVAYTFRSDLERLLKAFPQGRALDKDPQTLRDWNAGRIPVLFAHPASAGHGLSLQRGGNILVFFSINWNLEEHQQIIERIGPVRQKQAGFDRPVFLHYILARSTVDTLVRTRLATKKSIQDVLLEALSDYKGENNA